METTVLDGSAAALAEALERKKRTLRQVIATRRDDQSFRDGLRQGVQHYCATAALHEMNLASLKRDYARGTRQHMREVHNFLSSTASEDPEELRDTLNFVLGLLRCSVELIEQQGEAQAASALSSLDPQDLPTA